MSDGSQLCELNKHHGHLFFLLGTQGGALIRGGRLFEEGAYLKKPGSEVVMKNVGFVNFVNCNLEHKLQN